MRETTKGLWAVLGANLIWGLAPVLYKALDHIPPLEVMSHRIVWSFVFFSAVLLFQNRISVLTDILRHPVTLRIILLSTLLISCNWFLSYHPSKFPDLI